MSGAGRSHRDAIGVQRVERVLDLTQATVRVGERHGREEPETARVILSQRGRELVGAPCKVTGLGRAVVQGLGECGTGHNGRGDLVPVHISQSDLCRPGPRRTIQERRQVMVVDVDSPGMIDRRLSE